ncbi:MAG: hypothetical protein ACI4ME_09705 [Aristaeellaceae bacterium]
MITGTEKRTTTTTTITGTSSSSTRARAYARDEADKKKALLEIGIDELRKDHFDILGRPMPRWTEARLREDLESGTPTGYYNYALSEAASAPAPSWRYVLAIVARLKAQHIPPEDLLWWS